MAPKSIVQSPEPDDNDGSDGQPEPDAVAFDPAALEVTSSCPGPDPFDPASLRLDGEFTAAAGVQKVLMTVPVRKPDKTWFIRVHSSSTYRLTTAVIELKEERGGGTYLVARPLWSGLAAESTFSGRALFTAVNRQGVLFLWPIKLPSPDGRSDEWSRSAAEAADLATHSWVRVTANMALGAYEVHRATGELPEPVWPTQNFNELLKIAFRDRFIDRPDHPVLRQLRGEV